jgi:ubiquinone/menaquinone biosynthesis C-methylase UbiE
MSDHPALPNTCGLNLCHLPGVLRHPRDALAEQTSTDRLTVMGPFDVSAVRAAYDTVAEDYAEAFAGDLLRLQLDRQVLDGFVQSVAAGEPVLDLGCGPGQVGQYLAERGLLVVGLDLAQQMLQVARRRTGNDRMACGDMRSIPFRSSAFSGVVAFYSVHNLPRPELRTALDEIRRILKPSGSFVVATHLGKGEVYSTEFLGHDIETVGGVLYRDDELLAVLDRRSFVVEEVRYRDPLPHEHNTQRIYLTCRRTDR